MINISPFATPQVILDPVDGLISWLIDEMIITINSAIKKKFLTSSKISTSTSEDTSYLEENSTTNLIDSLERENAIKFHSYIMSVDMPLRPSNLLKTEMVVSFIIHFWCSGVP